MFRVTSIIYVTHAKGSIAVAEYMTRSTLENGMSYRLTPQVYNSAFKSPTAGFVPLSVELYKSNAV
jgi:hypothetical protein